MWRRTRPCASLTGQRHHRSVPAVIEGVRVRQAARVDGPHRTGLHSPGGGARRGQRRRGGRQDHQAAQRPGMNLEGRIVQIIARASAQFVGTYFEDGMAGYVKIDGTTFHAPIYVGDPGAKGARPGDKVALKIVRYPTPSMEGEGVITELLGPGGQPGVDTLSVIRAFNIPDTFDDAALDEARQEARSSPRTRSASGSTSAML